MEGVPFFPEYNPDDDHESPTEKKEKKASKEKKPALFERPKESEKQKEAVKETVEKKDSDSEQALEKLSDEEQQHVATEYVDARSQELQTELATTTPETSEEAAVLANAAFLEAIQARLHNHEAPDDQVLDSLVSETLDDLGVEEPEMPVEDLGANTEIIDEIIDLNPADGADVTLPLAPAQATPPAPISGGATGIMGGLGGQPFRGAVSVPNMQPTPTVETVVDRRGNGGAVLVGGVVGYLIGRRRGRIKTEKKLLPIQKKLENEVIDLQNKIGLREQKIRFLTQEQLRQKPDSNKGIVERLEKKMLEKNNQRNQTERIFSTNKPEKIGKLDVLAERPSVTEAIKLTPEKLPSVANMTRSELLSVAERIPLEQSNLRRLFETNHIGEEGVRKVVAAFLKGEKYEHILQNNVISPEKYNYAETLQPGARLSNQDIGGVTSARPALPKDFVAGAAHTQGVDAGSPGHSAQRQAYITPDKKQATTGLVVAMVVTAIAFVVIVLTR